LWNPVPFPTMNVFPGIIRRIIERIIGSPVESIVLAVGFFILIFFLRPISGTPFDVSYSSIVRDREGKVLRVFLGGDEQWCFPPDSSIPLSSELVESVLFYEDRNYYSHFGVDFSALFRAFWQNLQEGRIISGASTITMQLIRLSEPRQRNILTKLIEITLALRLNLKYNKEDILRMYLDHAPYGGNIRGIRAASWRYFKKEPVQISWAEAAVLAILPNAPGLISPTQDPLKLLHKRNLFLDRMKDEGIIDEEILQLSKAEAIPAREFSIPMYAAHLSEYLVSGRDSQQIDTTIDLDIQRASEEIISRYSVYMKTLGIRNMSVIIADTSSREIRGYIASQDYFDVSGLGWIDGARAPRSSGSILKPFLYGLAMDEGMIISDSLLEDVPVHYGSFSPTNADHSYHGLVTAKDALIQSFNIPATRLLDEYGILQFYQFLKDGGITTLFRHPFDYGLPLILGGAETSLIEITGLYAGLGNYGNFKPLRVIPEAELPGGKEIEDNQLISPFAAFSILQILKELDRPGAEYYWDQFSKQRPIAWKTGTSYGQRDAWSIGTSPRWTIGVWVGNFDGEENGNIRGSTIAAPLLFDILNSLPGSSEETWFEEGIRWTRHEKVSPQTGYRVGSLDTDFEFLPVPVDSKPLKISPYHKNVFIDEIFGFEVCSSCWNHETLKEEVRLIYPPNILSFMRARGNLYGEPLQHNPDCPNNGTFHPINMLYPEEGTHLWIPRDIGGVLQKVTLQAAHSISGALLYWYVDDVYYGSTQREHELAVELKRGEHKITLIDKQGNRLVCGFTVESAEE
jgi:penicillin-binding protein 1C